jgi:ribosomal protein S18 acetylase RimI-like enzyme
MSSTIRSAQKSDLNFLQDMLYEAATWRAKSDPVDRAAVLAEPHVARYLSHWGRPGDTALVAIDQQGERVGAAWFRFFSRDEPAYGFIDETIPELSIAVLPDVRGRGVGRSLLSVLIDAAGQQSINALSLSIEEDNPAIRLYQRLGFRMVGRTRNALTMRLDLTADLKNS